MSGPWARLGSLVSLSSFTAGAVVFAPPRLRAAPPPGPGPAPGSRPDYCAPRPRRARLALTTPPPSYSLLFALAAGRAAAMPSMLARDHCKGGGRVLRPPWSPPPAGGGRGRGRAPTRQAPCWPGTEGEGSGAVPISLHPGCARCAVLPFATLFIPLGITGAVDEASSLAHCVIDSRIRGSLDRVESDWVHETARCIGSPWDSRLTVLLTRATAEAPTALSPKFS
jgi:hypothetical protein